MMRRVYLVNNKEEDDTREFTRFVIGVILMCLIFRIFFQIVRVDGESMYPTLKNGELLVINKQVVRNVYNIKRGDVIVAKTGTKHYVIKRVVGLPGDEIEVSPKGMVKINNEILEEKYLNPFTDDTVIVTGIDGTEKTKIPEGQYFIMGDNRFDSLDSREYGSVPQKDFLGKVVFSFSNK